jgi:hypothetical protein
MRVGYLSLDLDFWWADKSPVDEEFVDRLVTCFEGNNKCVAAFDHQSVLPHVSRYWNVCNTLVNQDWHSDLGGYDLNGSKCRYWKKPDLNCGTWCDHVWWQDMDTFVWGHPTTDCAKPGGDGRCDDQSYNAFDHGHSDWNNAMLVHAKVCNGYSVRISGGNVTYVLPGGVLVPVIAMSFVLSARWAGDDAAGVFMRLVKRHNIHIIDGLQGKTRKAEKHG